MCTHFGGIFIFHLINSMVYNVRLRGPSVPKKYPKCEFGVCGSCGKHFGVKYDILHSDSGDIVDNAPRKLPKMQDSRQPGTHNS